MKPAQKSEKPHVQKNSVVTLCYRLCNSEYKILEERTATDPLTYVQGQEQLLPAVELAIEGQSAGYQTALKLTPDQAYGPYREELVSEVPRNQFAEHLDLRLGMKFNTLGPDGQAVVVSIQKIQDDLITLDGNHPLAGQELIFELNILAVRSASDEDIQNIEVPSDKKAKLH